MYKKLIYYFLYNLFFKQYLYQTKYKIYAYSQNEFLQKN